MISQTDNRDGWIRKSTGSCSVVFVHGLKLSGNCSWQSQKGEYWPFLLKNETELQSLGIYVYTYQSGLFSGSYSLSNVVDDLKERFFHLDKICESQKIIFVCHSMGGIVVRKLLVDRFADFLDYNIEVEFFQ